MCRNDHVSDLGEDLRDPRADKGCKVCRGRGFVTENHGGGFFEDIICECVEEVAA
jgi:hypothetical protein